MITIQEVQNKIDEIRNAGIEGRKNRDVMLSNEQKKKIERAENKDGKLMMFLQQVKYYLESRPSEEFLNSQLLALENKLDLINKNFKPWFDADPKNRRHEKPLAVYEKEMDVKKIKDQLKTITYILA